MLSPQAVQALNQQLNLEFYSSNFYLQVSAWCALKGLSGCAAFLHRQAAEEQDHMQRLFKYLTGAGALAVVGEIAAPPTKFQSILQVFQQAFAHEGKVTRAIHHLVESALREKDYGTFNFLQLFVTEQQEEEQLFRAIMDKLTLLGPDGRGLFFFDREISVLGKPS